MIYLYMINSIELEFYTFVYDLTLSFIKNSASSYNLSLGRFILIWNLENNHKILFGCYLNGYNSMKITLNFCN